MNEAVPLALARSLDADDHSVNTPIRERELFPCLLSFSRCLIDIFTSNIRAKLLCVLSLSLALSFSLP